MNRFNLLILIIISVFLVFNMNTQGVFQLLRGALTEKEAIKGTIIKTFEKQHRALPRYPISLRHWYAILVQIDYFKRRVPEMIVNVVYTTGQTN